MIWFLVLVLYICLICALASPIGAEQVQEKQRERGRSLPLDDRQAQIASVTNKEEGKREWLFELGL